MNLSALSGHLDHALDFAREINSHSHKVLIMFLHSVLAQSTQASSLSSGQWIFLGLIVLVGVVSVGLLVKMKALK
jgi:hypothetical protein